jgi:hypothetical protein
MNIMHWKHVYHIAKYVDRWNTNLWMNKCHTNFESFYKSVFEMCFQYTILICEMHKLWLNNFCTISITKLWDAKFMISKCDQKINSKCKHKTRAKNQITQCKWKGCWGARNWSYYLEDPIFNIMKEPKGLTSP